MSDNVKRAYDFFVSKGWSPAQAAGIVGHAQAESGRDLRTSAVGDSGAAYGIFQWNDRRPKLFEFARTKGKDPSDFDTQLEFAQHELMTSESFAASQLREAKTVEQATAAFMHFERPQGYSRANPTAGLQFDKRLGYAKALFGGGASYPSLGSGSVPEGSASAPASTAKVSWDNPVQPRSVWSDTEVNQQAAAAQAEAKPYGLWEGFQAAREDESILTWLSRGRTDLLPDPNWTPDMETLKAAQQGIPENLHKQLGQAHSAAHLEQVRENILKDVEYEKRMDALGWTGTGLKVGASLTTLDNVALMLLAPEVGIPAKASMWARVGIKAAEGAVVNAATEIPRVAYKPTAGASDLLWAAGTGMALGGAFGAFRKNPNTQAEADAFEAVGKSLQRDMETELKTGTAIGQPFMPTKNVGAAQASPRETLTAGAEDWLHGAVDDAIERSWGSKLRWDLAGKGKASDNAATRAFTANAVVDVVGNADKTKVASRTAEEFQAELDFDMSFRAEKGEREAFMDFAERTKVPKAQMDEALDRFRRDVTEYMDNQKPGVEFDPAVKRQGDRLHQLYADYLDIMQNPGVLDGSTRRPVRGAENVERGKYRPNIADHEKIDDLSTRFGDDTMRDAIAEIFRRKVPELSEEVSKRMAKGYWRTLREAVAGVTDLDRALQGADLDNLKKALADMDLKGQEIDDIIRLVTPAPTEGGAAATKNLKRKTLYDNTSEVQIRNKDGGVETFRMKDLFNDDSLFLFKSYSRQMSGQVGMSMMRVRNPLHHPVNNPDAPEWLIDGITHRGDMDKFLKDMRAAWDARTDLPHDVRKAKADVDQARLEFMYNRITAAADPVEHKNLAKWARAIHSWNFMRVMNQVGLAQLGETVGISTQLGIKAAIDGMPAFKAMLRDAKTGELKESFAQEIEMLSGFGAEFFRGGFKHNLDSNGELINRSANGKRWNQADDLLNKGKRITSVISGMSTIDTFARRWASASVVMKIVNAAGKTADDGAVKGINMGRMAALGIDEPMAKRIFAQIKKHADFDGEAVTGRNYLSGNFAAWDDKEAFSHFRTAVWRWSRMIVQEPVLGQQNILLSHPVARTIFQFRTFMLQSWTNQLLRNLHHRDFNTFATFLATSVVGGMVYTAQQYLNSAGRSDRDKYLEEKISPSGIAKAMVQRGEWSSILPTIFDTGAFAVGAKPWFEDRASGTASNFLQNPSLDLVTSGFKASSGAARALREGNWSQGEIRSLMRIIPFQNAIGVAPLVNTLISDQPLRKPSERRD